MADNEQQGSFGGIKLFGFEIKRPKKVTKDDLSSVVPPTDDDGAGYVTAAGHYYGHYIDLDGTGVTKDNAQLINKYRGISYHPEVDTAIEEIVNEAIVTSDKKSCVDINLSEVDISESIKKKLTEEFEHIVRLFNFNEYGHDIFRSWYVDGRVYHNLVIDAASPKKGIMDIRYMDAVKMRKVKNVQFEKDPKTGVKTVKKVEEFFIYEEKPGTNNTGVKLSPDSVSYVTSGLLDENRKRVVSYLHKALKPVNQLRMMEDSLVIYRLARAPERRIFYIDVGNLAPGKAEAYMKNVMAKYRNKLVYDANTGQLKDDRKHMSMMEDFWLPRKEGNRGTEISTLPGGQNLGQIDDIIYFQKRLYRALNVPQGRLEQENGFSLGRTTEITREEVKFQKFIDRLRQKFSKLFLEPLKRHCILKGIITAEDWDEWKNDIKVDFLRDNHFSELKESEVIREQLTTLQQANDFAGTYFSKEWIMKNILSMSDEEVKEMLVQIDKEVNSGVHDDPDNNPNDEEEPAPEPEKPEPKPPAQTVNVHVAGDKATATKPKPKLVAKK